MNKMLHVFQGFNVVNETFVETYVGIWTCDQLFFAVAFLFRCGIADVTSWKSGAVTRLVYTYRHQHQINQLINWSIVVWQSQART